jgi:hypothetical protein
MRQPAFLQFLWADLRLLLLRRMRWGGGDAHEVAAGMGGREGEEERLEAAGIGSTRERRMVIG